MGAVSEHAKKPDATKVGEPIAVKDLSVDTEGSEFPIDSAVLDGKMNGKTSYSPRNAARFLLNGPSSSSAWLLRRFSRRVRLQRVDHDGQNHSPGPQRRRNNVLSQSKCPAYAFWPSGG